MRNMSRFAVGDMPTNASEALKRCEVAALPKGYDDLRPMLLSPIPRRYALKGFVKLQKE